MWGLMGLPNYIIYTLVSKWLYYVVFPTEHSRRVYLTLVTNTSPQQSGLQCCTPRSCFIDSGCGGFPFLLLAWSGQCSFLMSASLEMPQIIKARLFLRQLEDILQQKQLGINFDKTTSVVIAGSTSFFILLN